MTRPLSPIKAPTLQDIADEVGVSRVAVCQALADKGRISPEMRQKIKEAAQRLNYRPNFHAQSLTKPSNNLVGLFSAAAYPGVQTQTIEWIRVLLNERGYDAPLYGHGFHGFADPEQQAKIMASLCRQQPLAIVCNMKTISQATLHQLVQYQELGGTVVCYGEPSLLACDQVFVDFASMAHLSTTHLLELGHRDIGMYCPSSGDGHTDLRKYGYLRALEEAGVKTRPEWLIEGPTFEQGGVHLTERFLQLETRPTGMVVIGDATAGVFVNLLQEAGWKIPHDLSVVGHHGIPLAQFWRPSLTTVNYPIEETARRVVSLLDGRLTGGYTGPARQETVTGSLVARQSSAAPRNIQEKRRIKT